MANGFFPYPGGKAQYADWIIDRFPKHECYVEVFGGGAGVLYHKPRSKIEVYNDVAFDVWNFFDVYQRRTDDLVDRLEEVYYAEAQHDAWKDDVPEDPIDRAARFFFYRYANFGSKLTIRGFRRMRHRDVAGQFSDAVESLSDKADRIHGVTIERLDWEDAVDKYDGDDTLFYFDPPYVGADEELYADTGFDTREFTSRLPSIDGDWVVSYEDVPEFFPEYEAIAERDTRNNVSNGQEDDPDDRVERLLMNYDPDDRDTFAGAGQAGFDDFV